MTQTALPLNFEFVRSQQVEVEVCQTPLSSDAGLLPIREFDERLGWTAGFATQLTDARQGVNHTLLEMVRQRVFGILAGYEDQNDHDTPRSDPVFKMLAGRSPTDADLASQPTLSRFENAVTASDLWRLETWLLERFVASFDKPPTSLTFDMDLFDDPTHGEQQLTFFHGYYDQYQYEVRLLTCAENEQIVFPVLLHGTADGRLGVVLDWQRVVQRLRQAWPAVLIRWRGDCGFAGPEIYAASEEPATEGEERRNRGISGEKLCRDESAPAFVHRLRVSSRQLESTAVGDCEVRIQRAGSESPRGVGLSCRHVRRLHQPWRK